MKRSLYLIKPLTPARSSARYFEAAIIAASSCEQALRTHPASSDQNQITWGEAEQRWMSHWPDGTRRPYINTTWPDHPKDLEIQRLAVSLESIPQGVVIAQHVKN